MLLDAFEQRPRSFCTDRALSDGHYSFGPGHVNQDCGRVGHIAGDSKGVNSLPCAHDFCSRATHLSAPPSYLSRDGLLKGNPIEFYNNLNNFCPFQMDPDGSIICLNSHCFSPAYHG